MFDHRHYVPILKTKAGERWSLAYLMPERKSKITPLLEIHNHKQKKGEPPKPLADHVNQICDAISKCWGCSRPFFIDTEWINKSFGTGAAIVLTLNACRSRNLKAIPIVKLGYDDHALDAVRNVIAIDERGCLLRLDYEDAGAHAAIQGVVSSLKLSKSKIHLLLDYRDDPMNLAEDTGRLPSIDEWVTFSAASAAFPKTISILPKRTWIDLPRNDWNAWEASTLEGNLVRKATFSDYATRCSGPPPGGGDPIVHLRYTNDRKWIVYSDGTLQSGNAENMPSICQKLIKRSDYDGGGFSKGDNQIKRTAHQSEQTGGTTQWAQWCLNHHLTFVAKQIQSHTGI